VCVWERERERPRATDTDRERERESKVKIMNDVILITVLLEPFVEALSQNLQFHRGDSKERTY
jgi:hypothetical protein